MKYLVNKSFKAIREGGLALFFRRTFRYLYLKAKTSRNNNLRMRKTDLKTLPKIVIPEGYKLRTFCERDEKSWERIMVSVFGQECKIWPLPLNELIRDKEFDHQSVFFAEYDGQPVATVCAIKKFLGERKTGHIHMLGVVTEHRKKGLGRLLSLCALHYLREKGYTEVYLDTQYYRIPAIKMYRSLGFKKIPEKSAGIEIPREQNG